LAQLLGHGRPVDPDSQVMFGVGQSSGETLVVGAKGRVGSSIGELPQGQPQRSESLLQKLRNETTAGIGDTNARIK
jgi:hypothetical protein